MRKDVYARAKKSLGRQKQHYLLDREGLRGDVFWWVVGSGNWAREGETKNSIMRQRERT